MICIGLTGGIGSGKSYVAEVFRRLDIPVYNSDNRARIISDNNPLVKSRIISLFGTKAYTDDKLNRLLVGGMVFDNPPLLNKLNEIIHPEVEADFIKWCSLNDKSEYVIKEAAILFETGIYKRLHANILVTAPKSIREARIIERDGIGSDQINKRMDSQWSDTEKLKHTDYVINNDGRTLILPQVMEIHQKILENR